MPRDGDLRTILRQHLRDLMWVSVETGMTESGVPDLHYAAPGGTSGWIECKRSPVKMRPEQVAWLSRYARLGGRCFVAVRHNDLLVIYRGQNAPLLRGRDPPAASTGRWEGGPARWDWATVRAILTRPPPTP